MTILTIVIPTLNRRVLLERALQSTLAQSASIEIIVSDNGSTDETDDYLRSLRLPSQVRLFRHESTMPVQDHAAFQVSQVRTPWAVFLSDDDFIEPSFAAELIGLIRANSDLRLAYTGCDLIYGDVHVPAIVGPRLESGASFFLNFMEGNRVICLCATAFRIQDMKAIGRQPSDCVIGDMYYWTRILASNGSVGCIDRHLSNYTFYRPRSTSESNRTPVEAWAMESRDLATLMCRTIGEYQPADRRRAERARDRFLALTVTNHLTWNALADRSRAYLVSALFRHAGILLKNTSASLRAIIAVVIPSAMLERLMLFYARRLAARRR